MGFRVSIRASLKMFQGIDNETRDNEFCLNRIVVSHNDNILAADSNVGRITVRSRENNILVGREENDVNVIVGEAEKEPEEKVADLELG